MSHSISSFINNFGGGLRPNRFRVTGSVGSNTPNLTFHIRAASMPASTLSTLLIPYRGRTFKMPGNRTYATWQISVLDDIAQGGVSLWRPFHDWSEQFNDHVTNLTTAAQKDFTDKMTTWNVYQLDINGADLRRITLYNCWPSDVGQVALSMDTNDELVTFPINLEYSHYDVII